MRVPLLLLFYILLLLNVPTTLAQTTLSDSAIAAQSIENTYTEWYKTHYQMGGNSKRGIDCSHFTAAMYANVFHKTVSGSAATFYNQLDTTFTSPLELKTGDMVFFNIRGKHLSHVGVYVGNNEFVHATVHSGVLKSNLNEPYYTRYYKGGGRFNNLTPHVYEHTNMEFAINNNNNVVNTERDGLNNVNYAALNNLNSLTEVVPKVALHKNKKGAVKKISKAKKGKKNTKIKTKKSKKTAKNITSKKKETTKKSIKKTLVKKSKITKVKTQKRPSK